MLLFSHQRAYWLVRLFLLWKQFCISICLLLEFIHRCLLMYDVDLYESSLQSCFEICFEICFDLGEYFVFYLLWVRSKCVKKVPRTIWMAWLIRLCSFIWKIVLLSGNKNWIIFESNVTENSVLLSGAIFTNHLKSNS